MKKLRKIIFTLMLTFISILSVNVYAVTDAEEISVFRTNSGVEIGITKLEAVFTNSGGYTTEDTITPNITVDISSFIDRMDSKDYLKTINFYDEKNTKFEVYNFNMNLSSNDILSLLTDEQKNTILAATNMDIVSIRASYKIHEIPSDYSTIRQVDGGNCIVYAVIYDEGTCGPLDEMNLIQPMQLLTTELATGYLTKENGSMNIDFYDSKMTDPDISDLAQSIVLSKENNYLSISLMNKNNNSLVSYLDSQVSELQKKLDEEENKKQEANKQKSEQVEVGNTLEKVGFLYVIGVSILILGISIVIYTKRKNMKTDNQQI